MDLQIREYQAEDEQEWMRVHAIILSISHSWNYSIQERPDYKGFESIRLVAIYEDKMIGLIDTQFDNEPGEICLFKFDIRVKDLFDFFSMVKFFISSLFLLTGGNIYSL